MLLVKFKNNFKNLIAYDLMAVTPDVVSHIAPNIVALTPSDG